jgi:hypothetical protein
MDTRRDDPAGVCRPEVWVAWPVNWTAVWVGALTALATGLVLGLSGAALGLHLEARNPEQNWYHTAAVIWSAFTAIVAFVAGGWVAARTAGIRRAEPGMLHGALAWLVAVPLLLAVATLGAGSFYGSWYTGLAGHPAWAPTLAAATEAPPPTPAQEERLKEEAAAARNAALGAVTALLLGLIGSAIGGWWASGDPWNFSEPRTREVALRQSSEGRVVVTTPNQPAPTA